METVDSWLRARAEAQPMGPKARRLLDLMVSVPKFAAYASAAQIGKRAGAQPAVHGFHVSLPLSLSDPERF